MNRRKQAKKKAMEEQREVEIPKVPPLKEETEDQRRKRILFERDPDEVDMEIRKLFEQRGVKILDQEKEIESLNERVERVQKAATQDINAILSMVKELKRKKTKQRNILTAFCIIEAVGIGIALWV